MTNQNPSKLTAIILAGGKAKPEFAANYGVANRAMVKLVGDRTMLDFVVDAIAGAQKVGKVFVVGDVSLSSPNSDATIVPPGKSLIDNILIGMKAADSASLDPVLLCGADIPFVVSSEVDDLAANSIASGGEFCYPIIPMPDYNKRFPDLKRTTLKLREGEFTGGNIMLMRAGVVMDRPEPIHAAYGARKSPIALGGLLGWSLLLKVILSQIAIPGLLTIPELERGVGRILGNISAKAIVTPHASVGTDVDKSDSVAAARRILAQ